jgi:hypothetical protein
MRHEHADVEAKAIALDPLQAYPQACVNSERITPNRAIRLVAHVAPV